MFLNKKIKRFKKDHCTLFPDGDWSSCCKQHDKTYKKQTNKLKADLNFCFCLCKKSLKSLFIFVFLLISIPAVLIAVSTFGWYWYYKAGKQLRKKV